MSDIVRKGPFQALKIGWPLYATGLALSLLGIITINTYGVGASQAPRQLIWLGLASIVFFICATIDMRFIRRTPVIVTGYVIVAALLAGLLVIGHATLGAKSWFNFGFFSFQPADPAKLILIALLAKYFSRRHMEIGYFWHVIVSAVYAGALVLLILVEPDLGMAVIFMSIWFGMVLVSGIPKRHLAVVIIVGLLAAAALWFGGLHAYQRARIMAFVNPAADIHGTGYNAYQAVVATGSGQLWGKGIGYGTQSKLRFLPEFDTDFIFAAFAEEWGFVGVVLVLLLYGLLLFQLLALARKMPTNFDALFTMGVAILFLAHLTVHIGINLGLLPVTGTTVPFMSSGGSHLLIEFAALGIITSLAQHARSVPREAALAEYEG
ncbi:MAG: FtsW/RodA/SpoVE family cell cycle protein [Candidatus Pacebacteria bacterium]|nr:FtsW/RodA/SpoVE family cell cycle protein [Candidatus Paceibacterota bacterium]